MSTYNGHVSAAQREQPIVNGHVAALNAPKPAPNPSVNVASIDSTLGEINAFIRQYCDAHTLDTNTITEAWSDLFNAVGMNAIQHASGTIAGPRRYTINAMAHDFSDIALEQLHPELYHEATRVSTPELQKAIRQDMNAQLDVLRLRLSSKASGAER